MKLFLTTALCTGMTLAVAAPLAAMEKTVSDVEVKANLSAFKDNNVLEYWPTLEEDIAAAIASQLTVDDDADAPRISVEINKVAINGSTILPDTGEFNQLEGTVTTFEGLNQTLTTSADVETADDLIGSYALRMSAVAGDTDVPEGWIVVQPSQDDFYDALINAYAATIVERIEE